MTDDNFVNICGGKVQGSIQVNNSTVIQNFINQYSESYSGQVEERRQHLFDAYINRMFSQEKIGKPKEYKSPYHYQQANLWLTWLAERMSQESQTVFLIEGMQPTWIQTKVHRIIYYFGTVLISGLFAILTGLVNLPMGKNYALSTGLLSGLSIGIVYTLNTIQGKGEIKTTEKLDGLGRA